MPDASRKAGTLFIVSTPIGNLGDITFRAVETLKTVDVIAAEDTRVSRRLLQRYAITTRMVAYHEHNEREQAARLVKRLLGGDDVGLITDAGTPLISDPGFRLVSKAHDSEVRVVPVPGCCAGIAALSAAGLPTDRFVFDGFLPAKREARRDRLGQLATETRTVVLYESAHRILDAVTDLVDVVGPDRVITVAREMTKQFETIRRGTADEVARWLRHDPDQRKGEFVVLVQGRPAQVPAEDLSLVLTPLLVVLPLKQAVSLAAQITGRPRNEVYKLALDLKT